MSEELVDQIWRDAIHLAGAGYLYRNNAEYHAEAERVRKVLSEAFRILRERQYMDPLMATRFLADLAYKLLPPIAPYVARHTVEEQRLLETIRQPIRIPADLVTQDVEELRGMLPPLEDNACWGDPLPPTAVSAEDLRVKLGKIDLNAPDDKENDQ